jgi:hypothetical protein
MMTVILSSKGRHVGEDYLQAELIFEDSGAGVMVILAKFSHQC